MAKKASAKASAKRATPARAAKAPARAAKPAKARPVATKAKPAAAKAKPAARPQSASTAASKYTQPGAPWWKQFLT